MWGSQFPVTGKENEEAGKEPPSHRVGTDVSVPIRATTSPWPWQNHRPVFPGFSLFRLGDSLGDALGVTS